MKKLLLLISIYFLCLSSAANTLSDCISDALDRLLSQDLAYATHVYVDCDNLPLDLLTRESDSFKFTSKWGRFLYNGSLMKQDSKSYATKEYPNQKLRLCNIEYELDKDTITIQITPRIYEFKSNALHLFLEDWYIYKYRYDFGKKQWIFESQSSGGI